MEGIFVFMENIINEDKKNKYIGNPDGSVRIIRKKEGSDNWRNELENKNWVRIPHNWAQEALKDLRPVERWVLVVLKSYKGTKGIYPSLRELSNTSGLSLKGVWTIVKRLEKRKKIEIIKARGKYNTYKILC